MVKRILLVSALVATLAAPAPAPAAKNCHFGGNAKKQVCVCRLPSGRWVAAPASLCK